jgi:hypothetical protein
MQLTICLRSNKCVQTDMNVVGTIRIWTILMMMSIDALLQNLKRNVDCLIFNILKIDFMLKLLIFISINLKKNTLVNYHLNVIQ